MENQKNNIKLIVGLLVIVLLLCAVGYLIFGNKILKNKNDDNPTTTYNEIVGKWNTVSGVNAETGKKTDNLVDIFGSSYTDYGSYLELKKDGTFVDAIQPITDGSKSNVGKYTVKKDYYKIGDCYIFLSYSDGNEEKLQRVFLDDSNTPYLILENFINGYQLTLKK